MTITMAADSKQSIVSQKSSIITLGSLPLANSKLKSYIDEEMKYQIVISIREAIIENAFNEIHSKYIDAQSLKFVVHCACKALQKIVDVCFYYRDQGQPYYDNHPSWAPDMPPEPSIPDSWAPQEVPIRQEAEIPEEIDLPEFKPFEIEITETHQPKVELSVDKKDEIEIETFDESISRSNDAFSTQQDLTSIVESKRHPSLASLFTTIKMGPKIGLPSISHHSKTKKNLTKKGSSELIDFVKPCPSTSLKLPPLRVETVFKDVEDDGADKEKRGKKQTQKK